jgi:macrolide transport system ATP-binding/permease protein
LANVRVIAQQLEKQYPESNRGQGATLMPLTERLVGDIRPILFVLLSGAGLLLLISSVNVASLLPVRSESRRREIAVRSALGASQTRILGQFVTEGVVLVAAGSMLGLTLAYWTMHLLTALIPADKMAGMPFLRDLGFTVPVLTFTGAIALLATVLFSLTPTLHFSLSKTRAGLAEGSRGSAGKTWRRVGSKLVVVELATAVVLLVGAGLLGKSLYHLLHVDLGLQPDHVVTVQFAAPPSFTTDPQVAAMERQIVSRIESLPTPEQRDCNTFRTAEKEHHGWPVRRIQLPFFDVFHHSHDCDGYLWNG